MHQLQSILNAWSKDPLWFTLVLIFGSPLENATILSLLQCKKWICVCIGVAWVSLERERPLAYCLGLPWNASSHHQVTIASLPRVTDRPGLWNLAKIVKFGGNYEIWSIPISLVWMSLIHNNELMVRLGTFVIVIVFVFVVVFLLVRSCFLITLIKCLKVQKSQILLFEGAL